MMPISPTPEEIKDARAWVADCVWRDLEPEQIDELSDVEIEVAITRHYAGGWAQFRVDRAT